MTTKNHTSHIGEDAANGAMGERANLETITKLRTFLDTAAGEGFVLSGVDAADLFMAIFDGDDKVSDRLFSDEVRAIAFQELFEFQEATGCDTADEYRAALTAEKVAAEPVASYCPSQFGKQPHAFNHQKCGYCGIAAPQQPAQSAEQDERRYTQADMERYGKCYADARDARRAASTQSTATQPAQTQVVLTDEQIKQVFMDTVGQGGSYQDFGHALLAAQPAIGGKS